MLQHRPVTPGARAPGLTMERTRTGVREPGTRCPDSRGARSNVLEVGAVKDSTLLGYIGEAEITPSISAV